MQLHSGPVSAGFPISCFGARITAAGPFPVCTGFPFHARFNRATDMRLLVLLLLFFLLMQLWAG